MQQIAHNISPKRKRSELSKDTRWPEQHALMKVETRHSNKHTATGPKQKSTVIITETIDSTKHRANIQAAKSQGDVDDDTDNTNM